MAFEVVTVSPELLRRWTGKSRWRADEILPEELLSKIREHYACQGVIFAQLTQFHSYGPMEIGWKMQLVDSRRAEVFWAVDEVFNAGNAGVANAARRHAQDHQDEAYATADSQLVLQSPRRFGQFTLSAIFATLPSR